MRTDALFLTLALAVPALAGGIPTDPVEPFGASAGTPFLGSWARYQGAPARPAEPPLGPSLVEDWFEIPGGMEVISPDLFPQMPAIRSRPTPRRHGRPEIRRPEPEAKEG